MHLDGSIPYLLDAAMAWVQRNTRAGVRFERGGEAFDTTEIPLIAVRELIANALVHRDLSPHAQSKRVELRLKDDTLVIYSPGGLYGVSVDQLGQPEGKSAVNEFLYEVCKFVRTHNGSRVIEGEGGGLQEVMRALHRANMRPPRFVDRGINFTVLLPRHALIEPSELEWITAHDPHRELSDVQRQVLASMREGKIWTNASVRRRFAPIDSREARVALQGLVNLGFARAHGERAQTEYVISEDHAKHPTSTGLSHTRNTRLPSQASPSKATFSKNTDLIHHALVEGGESSIQEIMARTSLTAGQVRYALKQLIDLELIEVLGGWGVRGTAYRARPGAGQPPRR